MDKGIEKLVAYGPPNEWSGAVAGLLGPEGRRELVRLWKSLSSEERKEVLQKFNTKTASILPVSREKKRALNKAHRFLKSDEKDWNQFLENAQRKSFVRAVQKDPRADDRLEQHVEMMNRLQTGKRLGTIHGKGSGTGSGLYKIIRLRGGGLGCTCPDWRYRASVAPPDERDCKHILAWKFRNRTRKTAGFWGGEGALVGDGEADSMTEALRQIDADYLSHPQIGRTATDEEKRRTLEFVLGGSKKASAEATHKKLDRLGVSWDDNKGFMDLCARLVGKRHLDDMTPSQRQKVVDHFRTEKTAESRQSLRAKLQPGDILLVTPENPNQKKGVSESLHSTFAKASKALQGPYTHAALYVGNNQVVESRLESGVQRISLAKALRGKGFAVVRPRATKRQRERAAKAANDSFVGKGYSGQDLALAGAHLMTGTLGSKTVGKMYRKGSPRTKKTFQCGGLVTGAYLLAGKELSPGTHWRFVAPATLLRSPQMTLIGRAGTKKKVDIGRD